MKYYNPVSKEFQDECKRLGITGRQLTVKYKKEGRFIKKELYIRKCGNKQNYTDKELLDYLIQFYKKYGKVSIRENFTNNPEYPSYSTYRRRFGSWNNALKLVGMDLDTRVRLGCLDTTQEKGRYAEIKVIKHFIKYPIDLAGENCHSPYDGICPNGMTYDVKSSKLYKYANGEEYWTYCTDNKYKEEIELYYFMARNDDNTTRYMWKVPGEIIEGTMFHIGTYGGKFNIENMKKYDITNNINKIINKKDI